MELNASFMVSTTNPQLAYYSTLIRFQTLNLANPNYIRFPNASFQTGKSWSKCKYTCKQATKFVPKVKTSTITTTDCSVEHADSSSSLEPSLQSFEQLLDHKDYHTFEEKVGLLMEYFLIHCRVVVFIKWLLRISRIPVVMKLACLDENVEKSLVNLVDEFSLNDAKEVRKIEEHKTNNVPVKAVEHFLKERCKSDTDLAIIFQLFLLSFTSEH